MNQQKQNKKIFQRHHNHNGVYQNIRKKLHKNQKRNHSSINSYRFHIWINNIKLISPDWIHLGLDFFFFFLNPYPLWVFAKLIEQQIL